MTSGQIAVALAVDLALLATAVGLLRRGRWRLCVGFAAYIAIVVASNLSVVIWPRWFFTVSFWTMAHGMLEAARMWIGLEIAYRTFNRGSGASPAARRTAAAIVGLVILVTVARLDESARLFAADSYSHWFSGSLGVILGTLAVARAYGVRLHPFHAALLRSFAAYLVVFLPVRSALVRFSDWPTSELMGTVEPFAFVGLACWWAYAAWRRQSSPMPPPPGRLPVAAADPDRPARPGGLLSRAARA